MKRKLFNPAAESTVLTTMISATGTGTGTGMGKKRAPTTKAMLDEAFATLHNVKGVSLHKLKSYISDKYAIGISVQRKSVIKSYLHALLAAQVIVNVSGKGLSGRLKLTSASTRRKTGNSAAVPVAAPIARGKHASVELMQTPQNQKLAPIPTPIAPRLSNHTTQLQQETSSIADTPNQSWARRTRKRRLLQEESMPQLSVRN